MITEPSNAEENEYIERKKRVDKYFKSKTKKGISHHIPEENRNIY